MQQRKTLGASVQREGIKVPPDLRSSEHWPPLFPVQTSRQGGMLVNKPISPNKLGFQDEDKYWSLRLHHLAIPPGMPPLPSVIITLYANQEVTPTLMGRLDVAV